jgi:hypothetical protein
MVDHIQLCVEAVTCLRDAVLVPLFTQAQRLTVISHVDLSFLGETDVLRGIKEVIPVHPSVITIRQVTTMGQGQSAEFSPMRTSNQVRVLRPRWKSFQISSEQSLCSSRQMLDTNT